MLMIEFDGMQKLDFEMEVSFVLFFLVFEIVCYYVGQIFEEVVSGWCCIGIEDEDWICGFF